MEEMDCNYMRKRSMTILALVVGQRVGVGPDRSISLLSPVNHLKFS